MTDRLLIADAGKVRASEFVARSMASFFPAPPPSRVRERADAATAYIHAMMKADPKDEAEHCRIRAEFAAELAEIDARYAAPSRSKAA